MEKIQWRLNKILNKIKSLAEHQCTAVYQIKIADQESSSLGHKNLAARVLMRQATKQFLINSLLKFLEFPELT